MGLQPRLETVSTVQLSFIHAIHTAQKVAELS